MGLFLVSSSCVAARVAADENAADEMGITHRPNIVIVFTDDQGYQDVGCFGAKNIETPHLDRMAREGVLFTDFYVAQAVCSASRAALLTGRYSHHVGITGALNHRSKSGIHEEETTLAELLKSRGYATAIYGKWHLGHRPESLPTRHGFDDWFGLPYSNDMWPHHPTAKNHYPPLPLYADEQIVDENVTAAEQRQLTTQYTEHAVKFIEKHRAEPFLVYLAHSMPHVPLFVSDKFADKSERGLYGDVISEIDWSVGRILDTLERLELDEKTLVIFTSDNGPWLSYGDHAGSADPLREGKATTWEGGVRVPFIARWPKSIPAGAVCRAPAMTIDLLPTLAKFAGVQHLPNDPERPVHGMDISPLLRNPAEAESPHEALYFYWGHDLQAVRAGNWKLHFPHTYRKLEKPGSGGRPGSYARGEIGLALYDLAHDIGETTDVAEEHPEIVERLKRLAHKAPSK